MLGLGTCFIRLSYGAGIRGWQLRSWPPYSTFPPKAIIMQYRQATEAYYHNRPATVSKKFLLHVIEMEQSSFGEPTARDKALQALADQIRSLESPNEAPEVSLLRILTAS